MVGPGSPPSNSQAAADSVREIVAVPGAAVSEAAAAAIKPLAYLPHAGQTRQNDALKVLDLIDAGKGPEALALAQKELFPKKDEDPN